MLSKFMSKILPLLALATTVFSSTIHAQTFPSFGGPQEALAAVITSCAPAIANYNGVSYVAYNYNSNGEHELAVGVGNGTGYSNYVYDTDHISTGATTCSPALTVFNGFLYAAYVNSNSQLEILKYPQQSQQGSFAPTVTVLNVGIMTTSPGIVVFGGRLEIIYGAGSSHAYSLSYTTDGTNYTTTQAGLGSTGLGSTNAPALVSLNGTLYMTFQQNNSAHYAWTATSTDGLNWAATQHTNVVYGGAPTMIAVNNQLDIAFQQANSNTALFVSVLIPGNSTLYAQEYSNTNMGSAGSLAFLNGRLYVYYKQDNSQNNLFFNVATNY